ncbi:MAG: hypothetical protein ACYT04_96130, partial [Nostoc sp.]
PNLRAVGVGGASRREAFPQGSPLYETLLYETLRERQAQGIALREHYKLISRFFTLLNLL